jgi:Leucine rich repeat/Bacterial Ig-like domain
MKHARMFTSLIPMLSFVFILVACTPPAAPPTPTPTDTTRPAVTSVTSTGNSSVNVVFSEAIVGAATASNFSITPALDVTATSVSSDAKTVILTSASQTKNTTYALGLSSSIKDAAGNLIDPTPASSLAFTGRGGNLTLTVTGLPDGAAADVLVTGPDTFSQPVTGTSVVLENLGSGKYDFTVKPVKPDAATFSDDSRVKSLDFVTGGAVALRYVCSGVKPPDANLDAVLQAATAKATYNCADLAKITSLDASSKGIAKIDGIQYATGLTELFLFDNQISVLPAKIFDKLTQLTNLLLFQNQIGILPAKIFDQLTKLTFLNLESNQISVLPANIFDKLTQLTGLELPSNKISVLPANIFDKLTQLSILFLDNNQISVLPAKIFDKLTQLSILRLSSNQISVLPANIFDKLTQLTGLELSGNKISVLPVNVFDQLTKLATLILLENCLATEQEPAKTVLIPVAGFATLDSKPKAGCPQKTIQLTSLSPTLLTPDHIAAGEENVYLKVRIDSDPQKDVGPLLAKSGATSIINKPFYVLFELKLELWAQATPADLKIGEVTVPIAGYTPGAFETTVDGSGASYAININKQ